MLLKIGYERRKYKPAIRRHFLEKAVTGDEMAQFSSISGCHIIICWLIAGELYGFSEARGHVLRLAKFYDITKIIL